MAAKDLLVARSMATWSVAICESEHDVNVAAQLVETRATRTDRWEDFIFGPFDANDCIY